MDVNVRVPALEKLLDYVASGIGSIAGPMLASWKARREANAGQIGARGRAASLGILAEGQSDALRIIARAQSEAQQSLASPSLQGEVTISDAVSQRIQFQEEKRQKNIHAVTALAAAALDGSEVPDHEPNHDWTARVFNEIQDVSSEEMQELWARVLAGEVERPGNTSIRTLSILRNLDQKTARLFGYLCSACMSIRPDEDQFWDSRVCSLGGNAGDNSLRAYGLDFDSLNVLNEHGLIISDYNSWFDYNVCITSWSSERDRDMLCVPFSFQGRHWVLAPMVERPSDQEFRLPGVALTRSGRELSRIVGVDAMDEYAQALKEYFANNRLQMTEVDSGRIRPA